jgi:hypothetical protein
MVLDLDSLGFWRRLHALLLLLLIGCLADNWQRCRVRIFRPPLLLLSRLVKGFLLLAIDLVNSLAGVILFVVLILFPVHSLGYFRSLVAGPVRLGTFLLLLYSSFAHTRVTTDIVIQFRCYWYLGWLWDISHLVASVSC